MSTSKDKVQQSFKRWITKKPHIYNGIRDLALQIRQAGHQKYAIKALVVVARWHADLKKSVSERWLISKSLTSRQARKLVDEEPKLTDLFALHLLRSA